MNLRDRFDRRLAGMGLPPGPALAAVSGGADSLALLDLLARSPAASGFSLHVAHLDHGIHPQSAQAAEAVRAVVATYGLPFHVGRLGLGPGASETAARAARYAWLRQKADELGADLIFTAHHRDDQVETVLMRVLNGSGPAGLAGMAPRTGRIVRPLLSFRREELAAYARSLSLVPWEDPANRDPRHLRSWIRGQLLPVLRDRLPDVDRGLLTLARHAAAERAAWDAFLELMPGLDLRSECDGVSVAASPLGGYDSGVARALLGALGRRAGCLVGPMRAARIERLLAGGRSGTVAQLGQGCAAELSFGRLRFFRESSEPGGAGESRSNGWESLPIEDATGAATVGRWRLTWQQEAAPDRLERNSPSSWLTPGRYLVRPWRSGDRIRPLGGPGRRLVVRCMQDARIARHERAGWPVIETAGTIVWVPGVCRATEQVPAPGAPALRIDAHHG
ncbi:MAG TPA: tRNA lysidine(34) synthetase TilS [Gemmatimonadales bacterium]|nr:tRNA lysidine(34) synthetase TilS [Gemmatimonadales bacterium]